MWPSEWRVKIETNTDKLTGLTGLYIQIYTLYCEYGDLAMSHLHTLNVHSQDGYYYIWSLCISFLIFYGKTVDNTCYAVRCKRVWQQVWILNLETLKSQHA